MVLRIAITVTLLALVASALFLLSPLLQLSSPTALQQLLLDLIHAPQFWLSLGVGLMASIIDGALGMAYGVSATTFLLSTGASPVLASASVHIAEVFTTGFSGLAHARAGNVNVPLFLRLLIPGIIGAILGTLLITSIDIHILKPIISVYLLLMGITILFKAWRHLISPVDAPKHVGKLAFVGGFVDAAGGGGWGPVVSSSLIGSGNDPRTTIGSVNFAEFFVSFATAATFTIIIQTGLWTTVIGLVIGGLFAAPFAAQLCKRIKSKTLMLLVGCLIVLLSSTNLARWLLLS
jgi:hypothetical protein